jgi:TP53 regulating kinase-like protein
VHGDLTTSNLLRSAAGGVVLIDFGLSAPTASAEDKAVDLYVLERAFESTHPAAAAPLLARLLAAYAAASPRGAETLHRLETVRQRGRKRSMLG